MPTATDENQTMEDAASQALGTGAPEQELCKAAAFWRVPPFSSAFGLSWYLSVVAQEQS